MGVIIHGPYDDLLDLSAQCHDTLCVMLRNTTTKYNRLYNHNRAGDQVEGVAKGNMWGQEAMKQHVNDVPVARSDPSSLALIPQCNSRLSMFS